MPTGNPPRNGSDRPRLQKPYTIEQVENALTELLRG